MEDKKGYIAHKCINDIEDLEEIKEDLEEEDYYYHFLLLYKIFLRNIKKMDLENKEHFKKLIKESLAFDSEQLYNDLNKEFKIDYKDVIKKEKNIFNEILQELEELEE